MEQAILHNGSTVSQMDGEDVLRLGAYAFRSRLLVGTSMYPNLHVMLEALRAAGAELVTVAVRRINLSDRSDESLLELVQREGFRVLPNTAGCFTAKEAVLVANLAR
ncbi:MAG TPA: thiazole synthase, partial [Rhodothermales bacterium]|nr:thiazole synthase [Rhodothermales bacterium]